MPSVGSSVLPLSESVSRLTAPDDGGLRVSIAGGRAVEESKSEPHLGQRAFLPGGSAALSLSSVWHLGQTTIAFDMAQRFRSAASALVELPMVARRARACNGETSLVVPPLAA